MIPWAEYVGNHTGAATFESTGAMFAIRLIFEKFSPRWRIVGREREEVEEVDNEEAKAKEQQQQTPVDRAVDRCAPTCTGHRGRPSGRPQKEPVDRLT